LLLLSAGNSKVQVNQSSGLPFCLQQWPLIFP